MIYGAHPSSLLANPAVEVIKAIPSVWDETIALPMSAIGEVAVFARRRGAEWFLAAVNGPHARTITVPLSFLGTGPYAATLVRDLADTNDGVDVRKAEHTRRDGIEIVLKPGGGFVARFSPR
jgi:alpha-glucosidase